MTTRTAQATEAPASKPRGRAAGAQALTCLAIAIAALLIVAMAHRSMHVTVTHSRHPAVCGVTVTTGS